MTHRGPFQPQTFCDSMILFRVGSHRYNGTTQILDPLNIEM